MDRRQLEQVLSAVSEIVLVFQAADGALLWGNTAAEDFFRISLDGSSRETNTSLWSAVCSVLYSYCPVEQCLTTGTEAWDECTADDGRVFALHSYPVRDAAGSCISVVETARDITFRRGIEGQLQEALDAADAANLVKDQFIANISHELRTPLNGVVGITELLLGTYQDPELQKYLKMIQQSGSRLHDVVQKILEFTKLEGEELNSSRMRFHVGTLVRDVAEEYRKLVMQREIAISVDVSSAADRWVEGPPGKLRQILRRLLDNAIKFTPSGTVRVAVTPVEPRQADQNNNNSSTRDITCRFTVSDSGIGIPEAQLDKVFDAFMQVESGFTREYGGIGLGLTLAQRQAHSINSDIRLNSQPGAGTEASFTVTFTDVFQDGNAHEYPDTSPVTASSTESRGDEAANEPLRVLVAEDDRINLRVITAILRAQGAFVDTAENGRQAVDALRLAAYDIVLMDLQMPELDGLQATRIIRDPSSGVTDSSVPVVAVTAFSSSDDQAACQEAGMDAFLEKPISAFRLLKVVAEMTAQDARVFPS